jgi:hypothetical protein
MFASNVADTTATALAALSSGAGETLTTVGCGAELDDESPPVPPHARTAATHTIVVTRPQPFRFKGHLLCGVEPFESPFYHTLPEFSVVPQASATRGAHGPPLDAPSARC